MKLTDVLEQDQNPNYKYKWKDQPEFRGKAPSAQRDKQRAALGSQSPAPDTGRSVKYTPDSEHRGARPTDPRQQAPATNQQPAEQPDAGGQPPDTSNMTPGQASKERGNYMDRYKFTGEQAKLGQQILNFADRLNSKPAEFERLVKIVQQEAQRRGAQGPGLVPKEQQGA